MIWCSPPPLSPLSESSPRTTHHNPNVGTIEPTISKVLAKGTKTGITAGNTGGPRLDALTMLANTAPQSTSTGHIQMPGGILEHYPLIAIEPRRLTFGTPLGCDEGLLKSLVPGEGNPYRACQHTQPGLSKPSPPRKRRVIWRKRGKAWERTTSIPTGRHTGAFSGRPTPHCSPSTPTKWCSIPACRPMTRGVQILHSGE